jgi:hypothetical protein
MYPQLFCLRYDVTNSLLHQVDDFSDFRKWHQGLFDATENGDPLHRSTTINSITSSGLQRSASFTAGEPTGSVASSMRLTMTEEQQMDMYLRAQQLQVEVEQLSGKDVPNPSESLTAAKDLNSAPRSNSNKTASPTPPSQSPTHTQSLGNDEMKSLFEDDDGPIVSIIENSKISIEQQKLNQEQYLQRLQDQKEKSEEFLSMQEPLSPSNANDSPSSRGTSLPLPVVPNFSSSASSSSINSSHSHQQTQRNSYQSSSAAEQPSHQVALLPMDLNDGMVTRVAAAAATGTESRGSRDAASFRYASDANTSFEEDVEIFRNIPTFSIEGLQDGEASSASQVRNISSNAKNAAKNSGIFAAERSEESPKKDYLHESNIDGGFSYVVSQPHKSASPIKSIPGIEYNNRMHAHQNQRSFEFNDHNSSVLGTEEEKLTNYLSWLENQHSSSDATEVPVKGSSPPLFPLI